MAQTHKGAILSAANNAGITVKQFQEYINKGFKRCRKCKQWIKNINFCKDRTRHDNLSPVCNQCRQVKTRKIRDINTYARGWKMTEEQKQKLSEAHKGNNNHNWKGGVAGQRKDVKEKTLAKRTINHAIEANRLKSPKDLFCVDCGKKASEYHHYLGYNEQYWFCVLPVCIVCHHKRHKKQIE